jgi:transcriptional repressor NrdR
VLGGLQRACYKRPLKNDDLTRVLDEVEDVIFRECDREVSSQFIGSVVADKLRSLDQIAYVRFASVYRRFQDLGELIDEATDLINRRAADSPGQQQLF